jgi:serine phosphatase RsbU (regulator of sigma subunit)
VAVQEPDAFATVICAEIDPVTGVLTWASAGHPAPILVRGDGTSTHLRGVAAPPIGWVEPEGSPSPPEYHVSLQADDRLLLFTDGLYERRRVHPDIGLAHLMILAEQTRQVRDATQACETILEDILTDLHEDDLCLLIADFRPTTNRPSG